jgi:hypothetical protein
MRAGTVPSHSSAKANLKILTRSSVGRPLSDFAFFGMVELGLDGEEKDVVGLAQGKGGKESRFPSNKPIKIFS